MNGIPKGLITREKCRVCQSPTLRPVLSLGTQCISNFLESGSEIAYSAPLELVLCDRNTGGCGLLQLKHTVPRELLYKQYWYKSGINQSMRDALADITRNIERRVKFVKGDIALDIGCNDGTLLRSYQTSGLVLSGFEPAVNLIPEARVGTQEIINDFFSATSFREALGAAKAKVITAIAMFYDLEDPNSFLSDIKEVLSEDGAFVIQMNYLPTMLENNAFDNIGHEHLEYHSLLSLEYLLNRHRLAAFDVELNDINGGSFRIYIKHANCNQYPATANLRKLRDYENKLALDEFAPYAEFSKRINLLKEKTFSFIESEVMKGKIVYVYGASTRGNTLLQFYNLDHTLIKAAAERNPDKWGKKTVATMIPIISEEQARSEKPDYFLILPWQFLSEFVKREEEFLKSGGKFIVPLPELRIIDSV